MSVLGKCKHCYTIRHGEWSHRPDSMTTDWHCDKCGKYTSQDDIYALDERINAIQKLETALEAINDALPVLKAALWPTYDDKD